MRIRLAGEEDLPVILAIANWAAAETTANFATEPETLEQWREMFAATSRMYPWLVGVDEGGSEKIVGFAKASPWAKRGAYRWAAEVTVYVHPDHQRRGIGPALYGRLFHTLRMQNYRVLLAGVTEPNPASVKLHQRLGFERVATLKRVGWKFDQWLDVGYWQLSLGDVEDGRPAAAPQPIRPVEEVWPGDRGASG